MTKKRKSHTEASPGKRQKKSVEFYLTHPQSKLALIDLKELINEETFNKLSIEQRERLMALLPQVDTLQSEQGTTLPLQFFRYNYALFDCMAAFQDHLYLGGFDGKTKKQTSTKSDKFKDEAFEEIWGDKIQRPQIKSNAGDSKSITLRDLVVYGEIKNGDELIYKRTFLHGQVCIEKSLIVAQVDESGQLTVMHDSALWPDIENPTALETRILDVDKRIPKSKRPNGNAFKSIKLRRNGKDVGRLFDIRLALFERLKESGESEEV